MLLCLRFNNHIFSLNEVPLVSGQLYIVLYNHETFNALMRNTALLTLT